MPLWMHCTDAAALELTTNATITPTALLSLIHDTFAYVAVVKSAVQAALHGLREGRFKGRKFQVELVR